MSKTTCLTSTLAVAILSLVCLSSAALAKAPEEIFTVREGEWVLPSGGKASGQGGKVSPAEIWWYIVDPENDADARGLARGILLCNANTASGRLYSFLRLPEEQTRIERLEFSPNQKRMVVTCRVNPFVTKLLVYELDELALEKSFWGTGEIWWVDYVRFAFTLIDLTFVRPESVGVFATSAAIYEPALEIGYVILEGASATHSYSVTHAGEGEIFVKSVMVPSAKDWGDPAKREEAEIRMAVPAAG